MKWLLVYSAAVSSYTAIEYLTILECQVVIISNVQASMCSSRQQIENKAELQVSRKQSPHISCCIAANVSLCLHHSMVSNFYDVLLVDQNATLDEIKVAFKRRALQVHPDKGGSKEEFHMVYQALETLTDPTTRKKYDHSLTTGRFPAHRDTAKGRPKRPRQAERPKRTPGLKRPKVGEKSSNASDTFQMKQTKFLMQIHDLLKKMPRDMRNHAIRKDFTQSQRLILEKWMVDEAQTSLEAKIEPVVPESEKTMPVDIARPAIEQTTSGKCQQDRKRHDFYSIGFVIHIYESCFTSYVREKECSYEEENWQQEKYTWLRQEDGCLWIPEEWRRWLQSWNWVWRRSYRYVDETIWFANSSWVFADPHISEAEDAWFQPA